MADQFAHPAVAQILRHFDYSHLPADLQYVSVPFKNIAMRMAEQFDGPEVTVGLRKLLEAKDCFVRAAVEKNKETTTMENT